MKKVFTYLSPYYMRMAAGLLIKLSATFCELFIPMILGYIINKIVPKENIPLIFLWGVIMLGFAALAFVGNVTANRMASLVARNTTEQIRKDLFRKISYLSSSQAEEVTLPSLISRSTSDTYNIHQMLGMIQRLGVRAPIMLVGGLILAFFLDVSLTCVMIFLLPLIAFVVVTISGKGIPMYRTVQESNDRFVRLMREDITGIRVIKALSREHLEREKFYAINREVVEKDQKAGVLMNAMNPGVGFLLNLGLVLIIAVGAWRVNKGKMEAGTIISFMSYVTMILNSIMMLNRMITVISKASASANRIAEVLEMPEDLLTVPEIGNHLEEKQSFNCIEFDHVSFGYGQGKDILSDVSFNLKKGETLGIIGETGSGKSTVIQLLMRFYDVRQGTIRVDGRDVRAYEKEELRRKFGTVFQNDIIFQDTLRENIRFGRNISEEQIEKAICCAQAQTFVEEKGLDYELAVKGADLSGGQKQRVFIARALAGDPEILVLDDSSSALDYKTDANLRKGIREIYGGITTIIIAQRVSSIMHCSKIIVMEQGHMIGMGTHEELVKSCRIYQEIRESQMGKEGERNATSK